MPGAFLREQQRRLAWGEALAMTARSTAGRGGTPRASRTGEGRMWSAVEKEGSVLGLGALGLVWEGLVNMSTNPLLKSS